MTNMRLFSFYNAQPSILWHRIKRPREVNLGARLHTNALNLLCASIDSWIRCSCLEQPKLRLLLGNDSSAKLGPNLYLRIFTLWDVDLKQSVQQFSLGALLTYSLTRCQVPLSFLFYYRVSPGRCRKHNYLFARIPCDSYTFTGCVPIEWLCNQ